MEVVRIGAITDVHHGPENDMRGYMRKFVHDMNNNFLPDLVVELGDFCDPGELKNINDEFSKSKAPRYYVMGNHDVTEIGRAEFKRKVGIDYDWTSVNIGFLHIIFLDGTWGESHAHIPREELEWLERDLGDIPETQPIIVFCHYPIRFYEHFAISGGLDNEDELMSIFDGYNLIATFGGHYPYYRGYAEVNGVYHIALCKMRASYVKITVTPTKLEVDEGDAGIYYHFNLNTKLSEI